MKVLSSLAVAAGLIASVNAHTRVFGVWVNDVFKGDGQNVYIRSPPSNSPVKNVASSDIVCNTNNVPVSQKVAVKAGDKVTFEWFHNTRGDDIIDPSHKGPITVYIAPLSSNGQGAVWSKLAESGFTNGVWATQTMVANGGKHSVTLPASLKAGDYLLRAEIIALHEADTDFVNNPARGAQFYPSCSQFTVSGGGNAVPNQAFNFIGGYTPTGQGILFSIYQQFTTYPIPGPQVWVPSASSPAPAPVAPKPAPAKPVPAKPAPQKPAPQKPAPQKPAPPHHKPAHPHHKPAPAPKPVGGKVFPKYYQCAGKTFPEQGTCAPGSTCRYQNDYYSQCL